MELRLKAFINHQENVIYIGQYLHFKKLSDLLYRKSVKVEGKKAHHKSISYSVTFCP